MNAPATTPATTSEAPFFPASTLTKKTSVQIPCCLCGSLIYPNAANQCSTCLSQSFNLQSILQKGPGNADHVTIHQCRKCRKFQRTPTKYVSCDMESPELLALCLKQIPALQQHTSSNHSVQYGKIQLMDACFVWTEPHSMRLKLLLTVRTTVQNVTLQQRLQTFLKIQWSQCPDCNREYTHRTWQAIVQVRQKRVFHNAAASTNTLALLEMALAKNASLRQNVLQIDSVSQGFDFYFGAHRQAQLFCAGLTKILPLRVSTTSKMVSEDVSNATANVKYTLLCELVPLCRHDLIVIHKTATSLGVLSGRVALVHRLGAGAIHCLDASPTKARLKNSNGELQPEYVSQEAYYKHEKAFCVLQSYQQLVEFIVLDVELWNEERTRRHEQQPTNAHDDDASVTSASVATTSHKTHRNNNAQYNKRFVLADVQVVRAHGTGDHVLTTVSHLGVLLQPGDVVLGYDLLQSTAVQHDELLTKALHSNVILPDVVLVKKIKGVAAAAALADIDMDGEIIGGTADQASNGSKRTSKAKERRRRRDQGKKTAVLEESAMRMGLLGDVAPPNVQLDNDDDEAEWAEELSALEQGLAEIDMGVVGEMEQVDEEDGVDGDDELANVTDDKQMPATE
ncbi:hypothetical protein MPSEU_000118900 [Mayamaea pseudoterrestris]|nr:hypothetical protein MPSEU_000118900 [Mayamaea pseudoterrestris]